MDTFRRSSGDKAIDPALALKAAQQIYQKAAEEGKRAAMAGGLAMQLFGFTRATKDIDMIASDELDLPADERLEFGGAIYQLEIDGTRVEIDWIVRADDKRLVYEAALEAAEMTEHGAPIITPEWMVLLKYLAGRGKDHMDLLWLLQEDGLVNRDQVMANIEKLMGAVAFWAKEDLKAAFKEADFMKERDKQ
ncbi:hypothetical protein JXA32_10220 [Candidatus Sumerlaeota bacterium]|nr:hypothetical protein [Candidatus Sumerlaeota bacterium]